MLGIHRMFTYETVADASGQTTELARVYEPTDLVNKLSDYANLMGVSRALIATAETVAPTKIHIVTSAELRRWRVGTRTF